MLSQDANGEDGKRGPRQIGTSDGGSRLLKYGDSRDNTSRVGFLSESTIAFTEERERVYDRLFGKWDTVLHELMPFIPHIDVYRFPPNSERRFYTYVTGGMSDLPMNSPKELGSECRRVELVFYAAEDHEEYSRFLARLAHFPHDGTTWIHWRHTMPNGTPPEPVIGSTLLDHIFFMPSIVSPDSDLGERLTLDNDPVNLVWCVPITSAECQLKLDRGTDALYDLFNERDHPVVFSGERPSYV
jgi:hypothetical protein